MASRQEKAFVERVHKYVKASRNENNPIGFVSFSNLGSVVRKPLSISGNYTSILLKYPHLFKFSPDFNSITTIDCSSRAAAPAIAGPAIPIPAVHPEQLRPDPSGTWTPAVEAGYSLPLHYVRTAGQLDAAFRNDPAVRGSSALPIVASVACESTKDGTLHLIQIATRTATYVFDCVELNIPVVLERLRPLLESPAQLKLMHSLSLPAFLLLSLCTDNEYKSDKIAFKGILDVQLICENKTGKMHGSLRESLDCVGEVFCSTETAAISLLDSTQRRFSSPLTVAAVEQAGLGVTLMLRAATHVLGIVGDDLEAYVSASTSRADFGAAHDGERALAFDCGREYALASAELLKKFRPSDIAPASFTQIKVQSSTRELVNLLPLDMRAFLQTKKQRNAAKTKGKRKKQTQQKLAGMSWLGNSQEPIQAEGWGSLNPIADFDTPADASGSWGSLNPTAVGNMDGAASSSQPVANDDVNIVAILNSETSTVAGRPIQMSEITSSASTSGDSEGNEPTSTDESEADKKNVQGMLERLSDIVLDVGRAPHCWIDGKRVFLCKGSDRLNMDDDSGDEVEDGNSGSEDGDSQCDLSERHEPTRVVSKAEIDSIVDRIGGFGSDDRAGMERKLHRISGIRDRSTERKIVGLTMRVGRAVRGNAGMLLDVLLGTDKSILILGAPGSGKTTLVREATRVLAQSRSVIVVDTSCEIGGDGIVPHKCIGLARRMMGMYCQYSC
jgi:hypothetical protein